MSINNSIPDENKDSGVVQQAQETAQKPPSQYMIDLPTRFDRWEPLVEILALLLLALATLATAWSGYQSARWGGVQASNYSQAGAKRVESTRASTRAGQIMQVDIGMYFNWINAYANENEELKNFYEKRFRAEFKPAFEAWLATDPVNNPDAPPSPFAMPEYRLALAEEAQRLETEAEQTFAAGSEANAISDRYVLNTVFLASVLFLTGLSSRVKSVPMRILVVLLAMMIMGFGLYNVIVLPIT